MMTIGQSIISTFKKFTDYSGIASRREFIAWTVFVLIIVLTAYQIAFINFGDETASTVMMLVGLMFLPSDLAVTSRRLHDLGLSGWLQILKLVPIVGLLFLLYLIFSKSKSENNKYLQAA